MSDATAQWPHAGGAFLVRHRLFAVVLAAAAALRAVVMLGYPPVIWFNDSYAYVRDAIHHIAENSRPSGYPGFLLLVEPLHSFTLVALLQHLMGLAMGVGIYALLRRRGLPAWGASLAAVPVLFDAYEVQIEQQVMSDALFMVLVTLAIVLLCWSDRISVLAAVLAGAFIGYATIVRSVGLPLLILLAVALLLRRAGWRPLLAMLAAGAVPIGGYMLVFHAQHGQYQLTTSDGVFLYARVSTFSDCAVMNPPASLRALCDPRPPAARPLAVEYIWAASDPLRGLGSANLFTPRANGLASQFAHRAILAQPGAYLRAVASSVADSFAWTHNVNYDRKTSILYVFTDPPPQIPSWAGWPDLRVFQPGLAQPRAVQPFAGFLGSYQRQIYLHGTLLGVILLAGLGGVLARWRRLGGLVLLPWTVAVMLLVLPAAVAGFTYRYQLAIAPVACIAAGLAFARRPAAVATAGVDADGADASDTPGGSTPGGEPPQGEAIRLS